MEWVIRSQSKTFLENKIVQKVQNYAKQSNFDHIPIFYLILLRWMVSDVPGISDVQHYNFYFYILRRLP